MGERRVLWISEMTRSSSQISADYENWRTRIVRKDQPWADSGPKGLQGELEDEWVA